jgi:hypothetical protein
MRGRYRVSAASVLSSCLGRTLPVVRHGAATVLLEGLAASRPPSIPSLRSLDGNGTIPPWEPLLPGVGTACSPTGKVLFPAWEKTRSQFGNILFPGREKFPDWERAGRNRCPSARARRPAEPNSYPAGKSRDPKGLRPRCQPTTMPVPRETKQERKLSQRKTVRHPAERSQVSVGGGVAPSPLLGIAGQSPSARLDRKPSRYGRRTPSFDPEPAGRRRPAAHRTLPCGRAARPSLAFDPPMAYTNRLHLGGMAAL